MLLLPVARYSSLEKRLRGSDYFQATVSPPSAAPANRAALRNHNPIWPRYNQTKIFIANYHPMQLDQAITKHIANSADAAVLKKFCWGTRWNTAKCAIPYKLYWYTNQTKGMILPHWLCKTFPWWASQPIGCLQRWRMWGLDCGA